MSKIQSESNSQRIDTSILINASCDQYVKDTIWKQFTTKMRWLEKGTKLWPICQRYNLKAIHNNKKASEYALMLWPICQRYNLKAIHNLTSAMYRVGYVVTNMSKIQSESNSQHSDLAEFARESCDQYVKDTIWKQFTTQNSSCLTQNWLWPICQRYNLKAIHNCFTDGSCSWKVVTNMSKIQSESNSQQNWCS